VGEYSVREPVNLTGEKWRKTNQKEHITFGISAGGWGLEASELTVNQNMQNIYRERDMDAMRGNPQKV